MLAASLAVATAASAAGLPGPALGTSAGSAPAASPAAAGAPPPQVLRWRDEARAYEIGDGVVPDPARAAELYCRAARHGDADSQYELAWMLVNGRGIERDDVQAAHLFAAAAEQGIVQAQNMLQRLGEPRGPVPPCLLPPEADAAPAASRRAQRPDARTAWAPLPPPPGAPAAIVRYVRLVAPDYRLAPELVLAVIATESRFDPLAVSAKNAQGLMQLLPETAARFRVGRITDPVENMRGGMAYLRWLLAYFEGDLPLVLAAYNAGERAVERYRGVPPYAETRLYVWRIIAALDGRRVHPFDPSVTAPSALVDATRGSLAGR